MEALDTGLVFTALLFALILLRVPVAIAMLISAFGGIWVIQSPTAALFQLGTVPLGATEYTLSVIPLFVLMGSLAARSGLARELYMAANALVGHWRGGLAMSTVVGCAGFSTICGSSLATAATMGGVSLKEMQRFGYDQRLSAGSVAAGGTIGILIPPSVMLVVYALLTEQSIGALFAAGLIPGLILTGVFLATVYVWVRARPGIAPRPDKLPLATRMRALAGVWAVIVLIVIVVGGIYVGFFSPTESAGIGAFGVLAIGVLRRRFTWSSLIDAFLEAAITTAMVFLIIFGSELFASFLSVTGITRALNALVAESGLGPLAVMVVMLLIVLVLGCFMDSLGIVLLTVPVFFPVVQGLDFGLAGDGAAIWFGVLLVMVVEMGLITPPVGINVFVVHGVAPDIPLARIFAGVLPFLAAFVVAVAIVLLVPDLALWLPTALFP